MPDQVGQPIHNGQSLSQPAETERLNLGGTACCRPKLKLGTPTRASPKATPRQARRPSLLPTGDDFHDFQFVARVQLTLEKFRWRDCLAVVLHHHTARQKLLCDQKFLNRARQLCLGLLSIGNDKHKLRRQCCVQILPHRLVAELADQFRHFLR